MCCISSRVARGTHLYFCIDDIGLPDSMRLCPILNLLIGDVTSLVQVKSSCLRRISTIPAIGRSVLIASRCSCVGAVSRCVFLGRGFSVRLTQQKKGGDKGQRLLRGVHLLYYVCCALFINVVYVYVRV